MLLCVVTTLYFTKTAPRGVRREVIKSNKFACILPQAVPAVCSHHKKMVCTFLFPFLLVGSCAVILVLEDSSIAHVEIHGEISVCALNLKVND